MYHTFYGLIRAPFEMTPDPAFLYLGETHREGSPPSSTVCAPGRAS